MNFETQRRSVSCLLSQETKPLLNADLMPLRFNEMMRMNFLDKCIRAL